MIRNPQIARIRVQSGQLPFFGVVVGLVFAGVLILGTYVLSPPPQRLIETARIEPQNNSPELLADSLPAGRLVDQLAFELAEGLWQSQRLLKTLSALQETNTTMQNAGALRGDVMSATDEFAVPFNTLSSAGLSSETIRQLNEQIILNSLLIDAAALSVFVQSEAQNYSTLVTSDTNGLDLSIESVDPRIILAQAENSADLLLDGRDGPGQGTLSSPEEDQTALALTSALGQLDKLIGDLTEDKRRIQLELTSARLAQRNAELKADQTGEQLDAAQSALLAMENEFRGIALERSDLQGRIAELEANDARLSGELAEANTELAEARMEIARLSALGSASLSEIGQFSGDEQLADALRNNATLMAQVAELRAVLQQTIETNKLNSDTIQSDPAYQAALAVGVQAALVEERAVFDKKIRDLEAALNQARAELEIMEDELATGLVDQRFAEAQYSQALAETERLKVELERRAEMVGSARDIQSELLERLNIRYASILRGEQNSLTAINPALLDILPEAKPLWDELDSLGRDLGGQTAMSQGEFDEFSLPQSSAFELDTQVALASDAVEFAVSLDQSLSTLETLRDLWGSLPLGSPVAYERVSSNFGPRINPVTGRYGAHNGIDLAAPTGTPIFVQNAGTVIFAGWRGGFGRFVEIDHGNGVKTRYAHLRRISVREGDVLSGSDKVGEVGTSGRSTGPHLHYEIMVRGNWVDPRQWIKAR